MGKRGPLPGRRLMQRILERLAREATNAHPPLLLYGEAHRAWWDAQCHFFTYFCRSHD